MNPYRGCAHGCKYCYAPNIIRVPRREWSRLVKIKRNIPKVLSSELKNKKKGIVGISTTTDPYQPLEEKYNLTRYCLKQLLRHDFPVSIITKSSLVTRDIDLLLQFSDSEVGFTITTDNDSERKLLEPMAPSIESRISALRKLSESGIKTYAFLGPLYPTIRHENLNVLVEYIKSAGASKIMADRLNLKPGVWISMNKALEKNIAQRNIWKETRFGEGKGYEALFALLEKICCEKRIEFEMAVF